MSNLPPGCTDDDIERHAEGSCPDCGKTLRDGVCRFCGTIQCDECQSWIDTSDAVKCDGKIICGPCKQMIEDEKEEQQTESETE